MWEYSHTNPRLENSQSCPSPCSGGCRTGREEGNTWDRRRRHPEGPAGTPTLEAATSWAVLAAISWEQTISSSYFPVCRTTLSADSLQGRQRQIGSEQVQIIHLLIIPSEISSWIQQLCNYKIMELLQLEKISKIFESSCYSSSYTKQLFRAMIQVIWTEEGFCFHNG